MMQLPPRHQASVAASLPEGAGLGEFGSSEPKPTIFGGIQMVIFPGCTFVTSMESQGFFYLLPSIFMKHVPLAEFPDLPKRKNATSSL